MTPEKTMKEWFDAFEKARSCFRRAIIQYKKRNDTTKADAQNLANVKAAVYRMSQAYDEVSAIWENDINV